MDKKNHQDNVVTVSLEAAHLIILLSWTHYHEMKQFLSHNFFLLVWMKAILVISISWLEENNVMLHFCTLEMILIIILNGIKIPTELALALLLFPR